MCETLAHLDSVFFNIFSYQDLIRIPCVFNLQCCFACFHPRPAAPVVLYVMSEACWTVESLISSSHFNIPVPLCCFYLKCLYESSGCCSKSSVIYECLPVCL